jgi:hypothetical protein
LSPPLPGPPLEAARLRPLPHPYRAMLAICSDLDETPDAHVYFETARYLNTADETVMGPGLGLEVGNTIYFDMPPSQFAYWNTDDRGREAVRALIRSGHVDCFHSFGDLALTRKDAGRSLDELDRHGCRLAVWIDHAVAPTNFGADIMRGTGDVQGAPAYHADLTVGHGVRYVWRGRVTSVTGQDVPRRLAGILEARHLLGSARTLAKEAAKGLAGSLGVEKYAMHRPNRVLRATTLRDGRPVLEFLRANPWWRAVDRGETADGLAGVLTPALLERLVERGGLMVLYTHLGKVVDPREPLRAPTRAALARLAEAQRAGRVLVTTTRRLLDFAHERETATWQCRRGEHGLEIDVRTPGEGAGLCFAVGEPERARVFVNGRLTEAARAATDRDGARYVCLPWPRLEFPRL